VRWWQGLSPRRRLLVAGLASLVLVAAVVVAVRALATPSPPTGLPPQDRPGAVILVPGYGGGKGALDVLAGTLRSAGRDATVITLPGDGTGDLLAQVSVLDKEVDAALSRGAPSVDVIGYSAGGVVTRLWVARAGGEHRARRVVTLGSPLHGTQLAATGTVTLPDACPIACQQLVPGSVLLNSVAHDPVPLPWLSVWTQNDQTVVPPDSARLDGANNVALQQLCPTVHIEHGDLPTHPLVAQLVLAALGTTPMPSQFPNVRC
jgi:triacylglycerol lipase